VFEGDFPGIGPFLNSPHSASEALVLKDLNTVPSSGITDYRMQTWAAGHIHNDDIVITGMDLEMSGTGFMSEIITIIPNLEHPRSLAVIFKFPIAVLFKFPTRRGPQCWAYPQALRRCVMRRNNGR
jgi:hypothetical protein